jgi:hypothetical protein
MTLGQVEQILGPGNELEPNGVPTTPDYASHRPRGIPVVKGDRFVEWRTVDGMEREIIVGFENSHVCDKWYWEPSL